MKAMWPDSDDAFTTSDARACEACHPPCVAKLAIFMLAVGCTFTPPRARLGDECRVDDDCRSGMCAALQLGASPRTCTTPCTLPGGECFRLIGGLVCGIAPSGEQLCVPGCRRGSGYSCDGLLSVACNLLDETHCWECGCSDPAAPRCERGVGCR